MGVSISKTASLAPISLASTTIGFISFAFTLMTWFGIFWSDMRTIAAAPEEIPDFLANLKQSLYEERAHLRRVHKRLRRRGNTTGRYANPTVSEKNGRNSKMVMREEADEETVSNRVMRDAVRHMIRTFRKLERPFLEDSDPRSGLHGRSTRNESGWNTEGYGYGYGADEEEDLDYSRTMYRNCGLKERFIWLRTKKSIIRLSGGIQRLETRRIAKEMGEIGL
jgi:hypothetical protein